MQKQHNQKLDRLLPCLFEGIFHRRTGGRRRTPKLITLKSTTLVPAAYKSAANLLGIRQCDKNGFTRVVKIGSLISPNKHRALAILAMMELLQYLRVRLTVPNAENVSGCH